MKDEIKMVLPALADTMDQKTLWKRYRDALLQRLPRWAQSMFQWLLAEERKIARLIVGILMILGGVFSFLPALGLWMAPVGIVLLAEDFPLFQRFGLKLFRWLASKRPELFDADPELVAKSL
ncbi:DUF2892 domain-containing protein [Acetobacter sp.]|uniref:YgaP family membrane protein n=1 Tax=Acetobacter sp. TaxID=440 RepID=UPI0039EA8B5F